MAEGTQMSLDERADALEKKMSDELDVLISKSALVQHGRRQSRPDQYGRQPQRRRP